MKQTRVRILSETADWIKDPDSLQIGWITGMAGTGKTSIAKTVCEQASVDTEIILGGSFFCSRSTGLAAQRDIRCVIPTLTQLLARDCVDFRLALAETIHDDIQHKEVTAQVEYLLRAPLSAIRNAGAPILFVIDALNECGGETADGMLDDTQCHAAVTSMLEALVSLTRSEPKLPIKFLVTSRPESQIRDTSISNDKLSQILRLHSVNATEVNADIRRYITTTLDAKLSSKPKLRASITDSDVEELVGICDGLFVVAATAIEHTFGVGTAAAVAKFKRLLNSSRDGLSDRATAPLDHMYEMILYEAAREEDPRATELLTLQRVLASLLSTRMSFSVTALADLLGMEPYKVRVSLSRLHSVVHVPEDDDMPGLRTVQASFGDYLYSRAPGHIRIPQSLGHKALAHGCLYLMAKQLHFNISQSGSSYKANATERPGTITLSLEYACMQWVYHFAALVNTDNLDDMIGAIFRPRLLCWLEVMSLLRQVWRASRMLFIAAGIVNDHTTSDLARFFHDANSFVASSYDAIERSAPHIYVSAIPFADKDSLVYQEFATRCTGLMTVNTIGIGQHGGHTVMTLTGHDGAVSSVSYSSDGRLLASGSKDGSVRLWDTREGEEARPPFLSGTGSVLTVDFAQNSRWVASGTNTGVVCIWTVAPGQASHRQLKGHTGPVNCVKFGPDGLRLASASDDKTLRLWSPETGEQIAVLNGHAKAVNGIAFSPDGEVLASLCGNRTIRLWHSATGQDVREPLTAAGYGSVEFSPDGEMIATTFSNAVHLIQWRTGAEIVSMKQSTKRCCVRFSPDGQSLVAASDHAVRLWTLQPDPVKAAWIDLRGHRAEVNWATFSPDGLYIASASDDGTIRIWSAGSGRSAVQPASAVRSAAVSRDGTIIVSGSEDALVRVWDANTGDSILPSLHGHRSLVSCVAISADGRLIVSASDDNTVRLWDLDCGANVGKPIRGHKARVSAVTFSTNRGWLASASHDRTVRLWDVKTRQMLSIGPLRCHHDVDTVVYSPGDEIIAAGDRSGRIYLWRTETGELAHEPLQADRTRILSLAFSPDGTYIVSGGANARIWDVRTGHHIVTLEGHTDLVWCVTWSLDGRLIGTGSADHTVRLWDPAEGSMLATMHNHSNRVNTVAFTDNGRFIVSCSDDGTIRKWDVEEARKPASEGASCSVGEHVRAALVDGWVVGSSGELLLWVPAEYRPYLDQAVCPLQINGSRIVIKATSGGSHTGPNWVSCWRR